MKKIGLLVVILFFVSGCEVNYDVVITNNNIEEEMRIDIDENDSIQKDYYNNSKENDYISFYDGQENLYELEHYDALNRVVLRYKYNDNITYSLSSAFKDCFSKSSIVNNDNVTTINAQGFLCYDYNYVTIDKLNINVTLKDLEVIEHNADLINDNTYIWNMKEDMNIYLKYMTQEQEEPGSEDEKCNITCNADETLINANSKDCYCQKNDLEETNSIFEYILLGLVLALFFIGIIGLIKYKSG